jgi:superfamily II DNA or RNA helicase
MTINLKPHQLQTLQNISTIFQKGYSKCLVKSFCGTGKSMIAFKLLTESIGLNIIVFPSLPLVEQFLEDYISNPHWHSLVTNYKILSICSAKELDSEINIHSVKTTTSDTDITNFLLDTTPNKIIVITYQSFDLLVSNILTNNLKIEYLIYDEAHHTIGSSIQELVYHNTSFTTLVSKTVFLTATPKNDNGIIMYHTPDISHEDLEAKYNYIPDTEDEEDYIDEYYDDVFKIDYTKTSDCGILAMDYTHRQAVEDGICNDFNISIDFYTNGEDKNADIYKCIARSTVDGNNRILSFHGRSETSHDTLTNVVEFSSVENNRRFANVLTDIYKTELASHKMPKFKKITGITASTKNRKNILKEFEKVDNKSVYILASCQTIGEGVDTKRCNKIVMADPKQSSSVIIQNVGRVCRLPERGISKGTVLLPCQVDIELYKGCTTIEERDALIREDMAKNGNMDGILNVLSALRQDDPEYYWLCLNYPKKYSSGEIRHSLAKQGYRIEPNVGDLYDTISYLNTGDELDSYDIKEMSLDEISEIIASQIEIHSNDMSEPIKVYGDNKLKDVVRVYYNDSTDTYYPISRRDGFKKNSKKHLERPRRKAFKPKVHTNDDIAVYWKIADGVDLFDCIGRCYIESVLVEKENRFMVMYEKLKAWVDNNSRIPSKRSKDLIEKRLGIWCSSKRQDYKANKLSKDKVDLLEGIGGWYWKLEDPFYNKYEELKIWVKKNSRIPSEKSKDLTEKGLGSWCSDKRKYYKAGRLSKDKVDLLENISSWYWKLEDPLYNKYEEVKIWVEENSRIPSQMSKELTEKGLGIWCSNKRKDYKANRLSIDKVELLENISGWYWNLDDHFYNKYEEVKTWVEQNSRIPSDKSKDLTEKGLGSWCSSRRADYKTGKLSKDKVELLENISSWYWKLEDPFYNKYEELKIWVEENSRIPSQMSKDLTEKSLGQWCSDKRQDYKVGKLSKDKIDLLQQLPQWYWSKSEKQPTKKSISTPTLINDTTQKIEIPSENYTSTPLTTLTPLEQPPAKKSTNIKPKTNTTKPENKSPSAHQLSTYQKLTQKMATQNSKNTGQQFLEKPEDWELYHKCRDHSFLGYDNQAEIPVNKIISYLETKQSKQLKILDLGCGRNKISNHFANTTSNFKVTGYDHVSSNGSIACDISSLPVDDATVDICIYSQSLMGANWHDYIREGIRVLRYNGELVIAESVDRYDIIRNYILELGLHIKTDNYVETNRWFVMWVINDL